MRKTFKFICAAVVAAFAVSSCYDDALVWDELDKHAGEIAGLEERVAALETKLNSEVAAINSLVATLDGKVKDLTAADADLLAKITALNTSVEGAVKDAKAAKEAAAAVTTLTSQLDALDGTVDGIIADLEAALEKMDAADGELDGKLTKLAGDLKGISTNLAAALAKIAVTNVEQKADGSVVLTLADDSKVTISAPVAGDETTTTGLVTIVTVDGVKYWAVVAEDGTATNLGIEVGHPDVNLSFMVDPETSELLVSYDGGENYEGTDVTIKDPEAYDHIVEDFTEDDEFVTFTIGGVEYSLVKYAVEHSALSLKAGKTYFDPEETVTVGINVEEVKEFYVMSKPDGWKAKVNGSKLTVTAPKAELIESGAAESDGLILLHGTTLKGDCKVAKLAVAVGSGLEVSVDKDGNITITNALLQEFESYMGSYYDFANYMLGIAPIESFNEDPIAYVAAIEDNYDDYSKWIEPNDMYDEDEYTVDVYNANINELYRSWFYEDMPKGQHYAVWVAPIDAQWSPIVEEMSFVYYQPIEFSMTTGETFYNDIELDVEAYGAESVQFGLLSQKELDRYIENGAVTDFEDYMKFSEGPWGRFENYGAELGETYVINGEKTLLLSELSGAALAPNMKYYVYALPILEGKDMSDYTYEDIVFHEATTSNVTAGGNTHFEFTDVVEDYYSITVNYYAEDAEVIFYNYYREETYNLMSEDDVLADLLLNGTPTLELEGRASWGNYVFEGFNQYKVEPGASFVVVAIAVDSEGRYSKVVVKTITGKEVVWATDFNVDVESAYFVGTVGYLTLNTGDVTPANYYYAIYQSSQNKTVDDLKADPEYMLRGWNPWKKNPSNNPLVVQGMAEGVSYDIFITATNEDGEWAEIQKFTYTVPAVQKQWISPAEDGLSTNLVGAPARGVFDFGVNSKTKFTLGFSMEDLYPDVEQVVGQWMPMNVAGYQIVPTDAASGKINITQENVVGDMEITGYILYSDLSETSCTFDLSHFIPVGTFTCTKAESKITFTEGGIAQ